MTRLVPRRLNTRARGTTISFEYTPKSCMFARAGLARGPKMLNMVRTPRALRTGAAYFMAGW